MNFSEDIRINCLLWCDRRCCLCKKACGIDIEVHHIVPKANNGTNELDNANTHGRLGGSLEVSIRKSLRYKVTGNPDCAPPTPY